MSDDELENNLPLRSKFQPGSHPNTSQHHQRSTESSKNAPWVLTTVHSIWKKICASEQLRLFFKAHCFLKHAKVWPKVKERHKNNLYNHLVRFHIHWLGIFPSCCFLPTDLIEKFVFNHLGHQAVDCLNRSLGAEMWEKKESWAWKPVLFSTGDNVPSVMWITSLRHGRN